MLGKPDLFATMIAAGGALDAPRRSTNKMMYGHDDYKKRGYLEKKHQKRLRRKELAKASKKRNRRK